MKKTALLLEDDTLQAKTIKNAVEEHFHGVMVEVVETESEAYRRFEEMAEAESKPCLVISDVMMPWALPGPDIPKPPKAVIDGTFRKAGIRCWKKFRQTKQFKKTPWIFFTVLDDETIEFETHADEFTGYAQKDGPVKPLLDEIKEYLKINDNWEETDGSITRRLSASAAMRQILIDGLRTPLSECSPMLL